MQLIIIPNTTVHSHNGGNGLLRSAMCQQPLDDVMFHCLRNSSSFKGKRSVVAVPRDWPCRAHRAESKNITYYDGNIPITAPRVSRLYRDLWFVISNGKFATRVGGWWFEGVMTQLQADVITINVLPQLQPAHEKVLTTPEGKLVGFRRYYDNLARPAPIPPVWPHHVFIRSNILRKSLVGGTLPLNFGEFIQRCSLRLLRVVSLDVGGEILDLETERDLLTFITVWHPELVKHRFGSSVSNASKAAQRGGDVLLSPGAKLFGGILLGEDVNIGERAILVGPTVVGNNVEIGKGAVISKSVIGSGISIPANQIVRDRILIGLPEQANIRGEKANRDERSVDARRGWSARASSFRIWPRLSYGGLFKRVIDLTIAILVLVLFAPVVPFIALAIKLNSQGPVFFKDRRQGLHGKAFHCLKFRTMLKGADKIQDDLRVVNEVDGPQFRIEDDPRTNAVGRFLRDTHIDEIPQFLNVLLGQMSVVGPRPSPEAENTLCPYWRDARLSVRPGITGLWQVCRTRRPMRDFQEWIHYDVQYVRGLSLHLDLWICWLTARKLVRKFVGQF